MVVNRLAVIDVRRCAVSKPFLKNLFFKNGLITAYSALQNTARGPRGANINQTSTIYPPPEILRTVTPDILCFTSILFPY
jgi:hypothetical protein